MAPDREIVLITGGNTGIGLEAVRALAASPVAYHIIVGSRTPSKGEAAVEAVKSELPSTASTFAVQQVDLCSDDSLEAAVRAIEEQHGHLDVLVNNSGAAFDGEVPAGRMTLRQAWNASWDTNVSGTHVLTTLCCPLLLRSPSPRLLFLTSGASTLTESEVTDGDNANLNRLNGSPPAGWPKTQGSPVSSYRSVKTGLNMLMREWMRILRNDGVKIWAISPGFLATNLGGAGAEKLKEMGAGDPSLGGKFISDVIQGKRDQDVGKAIRRDMIQPW